MRPRIFTMPFTRLGDFPELEFGPDDSLTVRPLFSFDATTTATLLDRVTALAAEAEKPERPEDIRDAESQQIVVDLMNLCIVEWTLRDAEAKTIPIPKAPSDLLALPAGLGGAFFTFLTTFRGDGPNPTTGT